MCRRENGTERSRSTRGVTLEALQVLGVRRGIEERVELAGVGEAHADQPAPSVGIVVDELRRVDHGLVDLDDRARERRDDARYGLDRLELAVLTSRLDLRPVLGRQVDDEVAERVL